MDYNTTIKIPRKELEMVNSYFNLTGKELYDKYGLRKNDTITYSAQFEDEFEAEISVVIQDEDNKPHINAILFDDSGSSLIITSRIRGPLHNDYYFELDVTGGEGNDYYCVTVEAE